MKILRFNDANEIFFLILWVGFSLSLSLCLYLPRCSSFSSDVDSVGIFIIPPSTILSGHMVLKEPIYPCVLLCVYENVVFHFLPLALAISRKLDRLKFTITMCWLYFWDGWRLVWMSSIKPHALCVRVYMVSHGFNIVCFVFQPFNVNIMCVMCMRLIRMRWHRTEF